MSSYEDGFAEIARYGFSWDAMKGYEQGRPNSFMRAMMRGEYDTHRDQIHAQIVDDLLIDIFGSELYE